MNTTRLGAFAEGFEDALHELQGELERTAARVAALPTTPCPGVAEGLRMHAQELKRLFDRLGSESATVFIFGPANSGKSTLVNALARAPLVEVSPLPGYPAPLFVAWGERPEVACQRFDGTLESGFGHASARVELRRGQAELARRVREVREAGRVFDPSEHAHAFRRIDVDVPSADLRRAHLSYVECPPLSGPLFKAFADMLMGAQGGPDVGVFVVRSGDLFDDAAFEGLEELLARFDRVHLVVNLDERGRDLAEDGTVVPGLEARDPARLVETFESLCPRPALVRALEEGRVRVFPIDLIEAAGACLRAPAAAAATAADGDEPAVSDGALVDGRLDMDLAAGVEADVAASGELVTLDELERRLLDTLDASEELSLLIKSSLRRAREILGETHELFESNDIANARAERERSEAELDDLVERRAALERLAARSDAEWELEPLFGELRERLDVQARQTAEARREGLREICGALLDDWFLSGESLEELLSERLGPRFADARAELVRSVAAGLRASWHPSLAGFEGSAREDLVRGGVDLEAFADVASDAVGAAALPLRPLDVEDVPIRHGFVDRLLLRSSARLRRKILGAPEAPAKKLPTSVKEKRFDDAGRERLRENLNRRIDLFLGDLGRRVAADATAHQAHVFAGTLREEAHVRLAQLEEPLEELDRRIHALRELDVLTHQLAPVRAAAADRLEPLAAHARADLDVLVPRTPAIHELEPHPPLQHEAPPAAAAKPAPTPQSNDPFA